MILCVETTAGKGERNGVGAGRPPTPPRGRNMAADGEG